MKPKNTKKITYRRYERNVGIPAIIIEGKFLNELGFKLGYKANIKYQKGKIIIDIKQKE